jgi:hypothetical protein
MKSRQVGELQEVPQFIAARQLNDMPVASIQNNARPMAELNKFDKQKVDRGVAIFKKFHQMLEPIRTREANW